MLLLNKSSFFRWTIKKIIIFLKTLLSPKKYFWYKIQSYKNHLFILVRIKNLSETCFISHEFILSISIFCCCSEASGSIRRFFPTEFCSSKTWISWIEACSSIFSSLMSGCIKLFAAMPWYPLNAKGDLNLKKYIFSKKKLKKKLLQGPGEVHYRNKIGGVLRRSRHETFQFFRVTQRVLGVEAKQFGWICRT